ncbi:MAG: hypothetical protein H8E15_13245 [Planctomycetes bacterium]|nr:hypothetical protein [Planctomycetota bacterium]
MADWKFHRRQGLCANCGGEFTVGETVFSLLQLEAEDLLRGDLCSGCFDRREIEHDLVWWRTQHAEAKGGLKLDFDAIFGLFQSLEKRAGDAALDLRFLLGLLMVRHRKLRLVGVRSRGKSEWLQLRKPRTQIVHEVQTRELEPEQRQKLTATLGELMDPTVEGGLGDLLKEPELP